MKERVLLVGGEVRISGKDGQGTIVLVKVPLGA
jgi:signal transduction histidine kinase